MWIKCKTRGGTGAYPMRTSISIHFEYSQFNFWIFVICPHFLAAKMPYMRMPQIVEAVGVDLQERDIILNIKKY